MARVAIACGGTGGHLYPGLAVAEELRSFGHDVRIYVSMKPVDRVVMDNFPQFECVRLPVTGWTGIGWKALAFAKNFLQSYWLCRSELRKFRPSAILGMGGFTCAPILLCGNCARIPTLLHESNAIPGKVTRWLAPKSTRVLLGFSECAGFLPDADTQLTGTPIRRSLRRVEKEKAAEYLNLRTDRFTIAVIGGSQGARGLNDAVLRAAAEWHPLADRLQIIHLTGPGNSELLAANYRRQGIPHAVREFCHDMENVYSLADLVIARSGAASLAEIASFGLPSILVPYPFAAEKHQNHNAEVFTSRGAALLVEEGAEAPARIARFVIDTLDDRSRLEGMATAAKAIAAGDPARKVAQEVEYVLL